MTLLDIQLEEGIIILTIGMAIVFSALILLYLVFEHAVPYFISWRIKKTIAPAVKTAAAPSRDYRSGEEVTAIATALYMYMEEMHDEENAILTISKSPKEYSPWSSKIYATHRLAGR